MKSSTVFSIMLALSCGLAAGQDRIPSWFVFLVTGDHPPQATREEIRGYQAAHIENFKRLFDEGKLVTAGPLQDATRVKRGIVVFCVKSRDDVIAGFSPDPYVQKGFMKIEAFPIEAKLGKINTSGVDPEGIAENRIAVFERMSQDGSASDGNADIEFLRVNGEKPGLAFFGVMNDSGKLRAIALFRGTDDAAISLVLDNLPSVKLETMKYRLMPQWLSGGVLQATAIE